MEYRRFTAMSVGMAIRTWRKANGLSQARFAKLIGVSQSCVCCWERDDRLPRGNARARLNDICGIDIRIEVRIQS